jgi:hypothetical protein
MGEWIPPDVGPDDAEGFRRFSLYGPQGEETIRVSFNLNDNSNGSRIRRDKRSFIVKKSEID